MNENNMSPVQRLCYRYGVKPTESRFDVMLPKVMELAWIPCSERLPEENEVVLTQAKFADDIKMAVSARIDYNYWTGWGTREINVVAWMPLPEPYKDGDTDGKND